MARALIFDCDGVLADTELHGHLPAFNRMWREAGIPWQWTAEEYGRKLAIGGGKERMTSLFEDPSFLDAWQPPADARDRRALIAEWHRRKSEIYCELVADGSIPARSGVRRLSQEALASGWLLAVASTSAAPSVHAVLSHAVGEGIAAQFALVLAGDVVPAKKPAPDIYRLAAGRLGVAPCDCIAIEDSRNGLAAATGAGMPCVITLSAYTAAEDFAEAAMVLSCLGDPGGENCNVIANRSHARPEGYLRLRDLEQIIDGNRQSILNRQTEQLAMLGFPDEQRS